MIYAPCIFLLNARDNTEETAEGKLKVAGAFPA